MPIYEYKCEECGKVFELLMRSSSDRPDICPKCGGKKLEKQFSSFSASVHELGTFPCSPGTCSPDACSTGTCPFSKS